eukprot:11205660-Alexandrium_andersonii.AAC.1
MVMTVIFHDIHAGDRLPLKRQRAQGVDADEELYADDAILTAQTPQAMNKLLHAVEVEGAKYGMRLNKSKCECVPFGGAGRVRFRDG